VNILIADDDPTSLLLLQTVLARWGHEITTTTNGTDAARLLEGPGAPRLAILDWMMPGLTGPEVCRQVRSRVVAAPPYLILLTAKEGKEFIVTGLHSGADDFIAKPFDPDELQARVGVGIRMVQLQSVLAERVRELEAALAQVNRLQGLVPICAWCKKVRNDQNYWQQVETYVSEHSQARFTHGVCPDCTAKLLASP